MIKLSQLTTRIRMQLLDAAWKSGMLWALLIWIAGDEYHVQIFSVVSLAFFILNAMVILKPLSYPIVPDSEEESADTD